MGERSTAVHDGRLKALQARMVADGIAVAIVGPGSDLRYLAGYHALAMERPTLLLVPAEGAVTLVAPALEELRARAEVRVKDVEVACYAELDDPFDLAARIVRRSDAARVAVGDQLWTLFTLALQERLSGSTWTSASRLIAPLREVKDATEIETLRRVGAAIDRVHARVGGVLRAGRTEREAARDIADMIREEHDEVSFVIVAGGPNSASPHHEPGSRPLQVGDAVVVDIGGTLDGYGSDCTRTYHLGQPEERFIHAYAQLKVAQERAVAAVRPAITAGSVDAVAREVLNEAGLGEAFVHRTGHGIGLDTHETPWILAGSSVPLVPGMTFSVEPGFYVPGWAGARIEDIVVVTASGVERLNTGATDLVVL